MTTTTTKRRLAALEQSLRPIRDSRTFADFYADAAAGHHHQPGKEPGRSLADFYHVEPTMPTDICKLP